MTIPKLEEPKHKPSTFKQASKSVPRVALHKLDHSKTLKIRAVQKIKNEIDEPKPVVVVKAKVTVSKIWRAKKLNEERKIASAPTSPEFEDK